MKIFNDSDTLVIFPSSQAFWLRSSVVSVLISLKTDMLPQGAIRFHTYFCNLDCSLRLRKANSQVSLALQYRLVTPSLHKLKKSIVYLKINSLMNCLASSIPCLNFADTGRTLIVGKLFSNNLITF